MLFLYLCDVVSKGTPQGYYPKWRSRGRKTAIHPSETAFHDVSSEVYCGLLVFANVSNKERHAISIHNGVLEGGARRAPLFCVFSI